MVVISISLTPSSDFIPHSHEKKTCNDTDVRDKLSFGASELKKCMQSYASISFIMKIL